MDKIILVILVIVAIIGAIAALYIFLYNRLQKCIIRINEAESEIDETLRKRHDILKNMEEVINSATDVKQDNFKDFKSDKMSTFDVDRKLSKIADTFRKIKSDYEDNLDTEQFRQLSTESKIIEEKSDAAKAYYNKYTTSLNLLIKKFPSNIIARIHGIDEHAYFDNKNLNDENILDFKL